MNDHLPRLESLRRMMAEQQLDGVVCRLNQNVLMLSGYWPMNGLSLAVLPREGDPVLLIPRQDERFAQDSTIADIRLYQWGDTKHLDPLPALLQLLRDVAFHCKLIGKRLGIEMDYPIAALPVWSAEIRQWTQAAIQEFQAAFAGAQFVDIWTALHRETSRKTPAEIEKIRIANQLGGLALKTFRKNVTAGRTECQIAAAIEQIVHAEGPNQGGVKFAKAWANVMSGPNSQFAGQTYNISTNRVVQEGDLVRSRSGCAPVPA